MTGVAKSKHHHVYTATKATGIKITYTCKVSYIRKILIEMNFSQRSARAYEKVLCANYSVAARLPSNEVRVAMHEVRLRCIATWSSCPEVALRYSTAILLYT